MASEDLSYRPCVGIMVLNRSGRVWIGRRHDAPGEPEGPGTWWQMPQGGIDGEEDPAKAALRELEEETGIRSVAMLAESPRWYTYDLPEHLRPKAWGGRYRGQKQKWFAVRFLGTDDEVAIVRPGTHAGVRRLALGRDRRAAGTDRAVQARRLRAAAARPRPPRPVLKPTTCLLPSQCEPAGRGCSLS
jgi:putative (di)nucleoside polyphosphate hydrolase